MRSEQFLQNPFENAEKWEENEATLQMYRIYKKNTLEQLITFYSKTEDSALEIDTEDRLRVLREIIAWKLEIPMFDYFIDTLMGRIQKIERDIKKLDKFDRHRHKTIMGLYTEKPVY